MTKPQNPKAKETATTKSPKATNAKDTPAKVSNGKSEKPKQKIDPVVAATTKPTTQPEVPVAPVSARTDSAAPLNETELRENGNAAYKNGEFKKASKFYSECIEMICEANLSTTNPSSECPEFIKLMKSNECLLKAYNNRTQCYLNTEKWKNAIEDATKVLHANPIDIKALYRRSQAYQASKKYAEALTDAKLIMSLEPTNKTFIEYIQKLNRTIEDVARDQRSTSTQTKKMLDHALDEKHETRLSALNNLIVLAREDSGCNALIFSGGLETIVKILESPTDQAKDDIILSVTRILSTLCKNSMKRVI